jgi:hypothetical protein
VVGCEFTTVLGLRTAVNQSDFRAITRLAFFAQASAETTFATNVSSLKSIPRMDRLIIWLNAGAIVSGIQFFGWFLGIFIM